MFGYHVFVQELVNRVFHYGFGFETEFLDISVFAGDLRAVLTSKVDCHCAKGLWSKLEFSL